jgi:Hint module
VRLGDGEVKFISNVKVGDRVLAADAAGRTFYSDVVFVPHGPNTQRSLFTHISTAAGRSVKMTSNHIIPAGSCGSSAPLSLIYASKVRVGDCIMTVSGEEAVSAVETVKGEGLYTIVTTAEYLVVNDILVSPFGTNHMAANLYYNTHRFLYLSVPIALKWSLLHSANEVSAMKRLRPLLCSSSIVFVSFHYVMPAIKSCPNINININTNCHYYAGARIHATGLRTVNLRPALLSSQATLLA